MGVGWGSFGWGTNFWGAAPPEVVDYEVANAQLLPRGEAWDDKKPGGVFRKLLRSPAHELARIEQRARDLIEETDPLTANELLSELERQWGLPEECGNPPVTLADRQQALYTKMRRRGPTTIPRMLQTAEDLGYPDAEIVTLADEFTCVSECTDALYGFEGYWLDAFMVIPNATTANDDTLTCIIHGQAHEPVLFTEFALNDERIMRLVAEDLTDAVSGVVGVASGAAFDPDTNAVDFGGDPDVLTFASIAQVGSDDAISIAGWFRIDDLVGASAIKFLVYGNTGTFGTSPSGGGDGIHLFINYDGAGSDLNVLTTAVLSEGLHHIAVVYPGGGLATGVRVFLDGLEVTTFSIQTNGSGTPRTGTGNWTVGNVSAVNQGLDGQVWNRLSVWSREITQTEVIAHMVEGREAFHATN